MQMLHALKTPSDKTRENVAKQQRMQNLRSKRAMQKDEYRIALNQDAQVDAFNTGPLDVRCKHCSAYHFKGEMAQNRKLEFKNCCHHGKVKLENLKPCPEELRMLLDGSSVHSENFRKNARSYNNSLAFASLSATLASPKGPGPYTFRVHGQMYHHVGPLHPAEGKTKRYSQLYIVDTGMALTERMGSPANENCLPGVMESLDRVLRRVSPFAKAYKFMWEVEQEEIEKARELGVPPPRLTMVFQTDEGLDPRTYNAPRVNEVAAIFIGDPGEDLSVRELLIHDRSKKLTSIPVTSGLCDPMVYPLLFPNGEKGWDASVEQQGSGRRVSQLQFYSHRLAIRDEFSTIHRGGKLFQQYAVDSYVKVEQNRLDYIQMNQKKLRVENYNGLIDYIGSDAQAKGVQPGRLVVLPSSFQGGPRAMQQNYQDAMAIVRKFGKPDLFITMTCNPRWPEITENLLPGQSPPDRPDLVARVFNLKLNQLKSDIEKNEIFGAQVARVEVIEFQKRGLPHCHMLVILSAEDKPKTAALIDKIVMAELPVGDDELLQQVRTHMIHGPCGDEFNKKSPCMSDGFCTRDYPKGFVTETKENVGGYPVYRRRYNHVTTTIGKHTVDNQWVVPYNRYLLLKYRCHINVEVCTSIKSVKYLFKYIYKGHDCASVVIKQGSDAAAQQMELKYDEVESFLNARYISAPEAIWRLFEYSMHEKSHAIIRLAVHLPSEQVVYFREGEEEAALDSTMQRKSTLTAWFALNRVDQQAREFLYHEIPEHYVFDRKGEWKPRKQFHKIIGRMYTVTPREIERFHLRLLLLYTKGAESFDDLKTVDGQMCASFYDAAREKGLLDTDDEWDRCLTEASSFKMPHQMRHLFATILLFCEPSDAETLWKNH
ncbi:MAG: hypothetical protein GY820_06565, partial [Gammaproteobacteria bacterium]|nr:hypothetical protein [Gammaproteobacteria bacterium]